MIWCFYSHQCISYLSISWHLTQSSASEQETYPPHQSASQDKLKAAQDGWPSSLPPRQQEEKQFEDGYEVMKCIGPQIGETTSSNQPVVALKEPNSPALGETVNLILSLGTMGDSQVQVFEPPACTDAIGDETSEPVHRVRNMLITSHVMSPITVFR